jgi:hypothetical protein
MFDPDSIISYLSWCEAQGIEPFAEDEDKQEENENNNDNENNKYENIVLKKERRNKYE